jgi:predicted AlkP superfamily phosphohydrolase/phosphomutase
MGMIIPQAERGFMRDAVLPIVIIGISGATWTVIDPMISDGALPSLRRLMREGSWGILESTKRENDRHYRPQTAWPSLLTGKLPEKHGITEYFHTYRNMKSPGIWDFFNAKGLSAGLYSTPGLWPPPKINGFVIPVAYGRDGNAWPENLSFIVDYYRHHQDSKLRTNYLGTLLKSLKFVPILFGQDQDRRLPIRLLLSVAKLLMARDRETKALILRNAKLDFSTAIFLSLYRKYRPHFCMFTSFEVDTVSHRYWRYHEPDNFPDSRVDPTSVLKRAVKDAYTHMDECIGLLLGHFPPECIVAIVSEHGMAAEIISNEIGRWQYLINASRVKALAGIDDDIVAIPIARWIAFRRKDNGSLKSTVEQLLKGITVAETGLPLFTTHFHTEDEIVIKLNIHRGDYPDMDDIGRLHVAIPGKEIIPIGRILEKVGPRRSAMHAKEGLVIIKGPRIRSDFKITAAGITDIMPTLLFASRIEVPSDLDGKVLDVFS